MKKLGGIAGAGGAALAALALLLAPAIAASTAQQKAKKPRSSISFGGGGFTPAVADPRLAAEFARRGLQSNSFRFTPSSASADKSKAVRVAVRARATGPTVARPDRETSASAITAITPTAYNLGVAVGWKGFALSGDLAKVAGGPLPGTKQAAEVGVSYALKKFTGRVAVAAERSDSAVPRIDTVDDSYSFDLGGSYRIARNLDVTGGVRYRIERDRLEALKDDRRDSQAVYIGTAFRF